MTREEKDILLKDLCARLPFGVKVQSYSYEYDVETIETLREIDSDGYMSTLEGETLKHITKPYLFPLSSITEEQYESLNESGILSNCSYSYEYVNPHIHGISFVFKEFKTYSLELIEWCYKNHIDINNLIPIGLALDATGLKIY